ncbi:MAG: protein translocase subunit SecF [Firmicutes bacterium]|nr:protein translocase subunit SecF [Bacillota bacterium]
MKNPKVVYKDLMDKNDKMWAKFHSPETKIAAKGKWYAIAPLVIIFIGLILLSIPSVGFNLGLEFTGGGVVEATNFTGDDARQDRYDAREAVERYLRENNISFEIRMPEATETGLGLTVMFQLRGGVDMEETGNEIRRLIGADGRTVDIRNAEQISATASGERIMMTFISIAVTLIAILIYMLFRFKFTSGVAAMIGLIHDALVVCALVIIFRIQVNYSFVAALITMVVYSLNNTIVLFDRIRRKEKVLRDSGAKIEPEAVVDSAIKETFARTVSTTLTTMVPVLAMSFIGVPLIREFALPIFFGLVAGTFSTIFVTTALYVRFENYRLAKSKHKKVQERMGNLVAPE